MKAIQYEHQVSKGADGKQTQKGVSDFCQSFAETAHQGQIGISKSASYHFFSQKTVWGVGKL